MTLNSKIPLLITEDNYLGKLEGVRAEALLRQPRPILWNREGLYCWISLNRILNQANIIKDKQKHAKANDLPFAPVFYLSWDTTLTGSTKEMAQAIVEMSQHGNNNSSDSADGSKDKSNT